MAVSLDSYRVKDATEWTPADVREFIETVLPGNPCVDYFQYTNGFVLCSLDKEDLRRQAKNEEAANVIWAELKGLRRANAPKGEFQVHQPRGGIEGPPTISIYVRTAQEVAVELDVFPSDSVASLKAQIAERQGTPASSQRLVFNGMNMLDSRSLSSYDIRHGAVVLLARVLKDNGARTAAFAPRGMLMVPGSKVWESSHPTRPYLPVLCSDTSRNFPVSLEFDSQGDCEAFVTAAQEEPPVIVIQPAKRGQLTTETRVHLDPDTEGVKLDSMGNILAPNMKYDAVLHFGGRGGEVKVAVVTGAAVS